MDALMQAKEHLTEKFLVMMGDDIYSTEDIRAVVAHDWALLVQRVPDTKVGGRVIIDVDHTVTDIIEGGEGEGAVSTNMFALDPRIFDYPPVPKAPGSTELGLPQTVINASKASGIPLNVVEATRWIQITSPDDLMRAEEALSTRG
jgi:NDP-sugar pyrophosphorylase family protein